jgi:hypothetical protein
MAENPLKTIAKRVAHADMARRQVDDYIQYGRGEDVARLAGRISPGRLTESLQGRLRVASG